MSPPTLDGRGLPHGYNFKPDLEIAPRELAERLRRGADTLLVVDVRLKEEWEFAHVPGSVHVPLHELEARAGELDAEGKEVFTLCHHGVRSLKAALALRAMGMPSARSVAGGIELWSLAADASIPRYQREGSRVWPAT